MNTRRIKSWIIDYLIITSLFVFGGILFSYVEYSILSKYPEYTSTFALCAIVYIILYFCTLPLKDVINKRSFGKKICHLRIVTQKSEPPTFFQLIIRNLTVYIWPVEVMLVLCNKRRIGDIVSKTLVVAE